jgi:hypothetical protein
MDALKFEHLLALNVPGVQLAQSSSEWRYFLEFADSYFKTRNISNPVIVEIGVFLNAQKAFYRELLDAEHIGIDISPGSCPDILGDSHNLETVEKLKIRLAGRPIDLLFIDGDHTYNSVKQDYELYGPLVKHLIALHDIFLVRWHDDPSDVIYFWPKLVEMERQNTTLTFKRYKPIAGCPDQMGIGLIIKESA